MEKSELIDINMIAERAAALSVLLPPFFGALPVSQECQEDACVLPYHVLQLLLLLQWLGACSDCTLLWSLPPSISPTEVSTVGCELNNLRFWYEAGELKMG